MAVHRQCWICRIDYQVLEKFMVNQFVAWLNSTTVCLDEGRMIHKVFKNGSRGG